MCLNYMKFCLKYRRREFFMIVLFALLVFGVYLRKYFETRTMKSWLGFRNTVAPRKYVLIWNSELEDGKWNQGINTYYPIILKEKLQCPVYQCYLTNHRKLLPRLIMFDAIVFYMDRWENSEYLPNNHHPNQSYILATRKPIKADRLLEKLTFNMTMTYRLNSDIIWTNYKIQDIETGAVVAPAQKTYWRTVPAEWDTSKNWDLWLHRKGTAAWYASKCYTVTKREYIIKRLRGFIEIDTYGQCGDIQNCTNNFSDCDEVFLGNYKFYFAFEEAYCADYITDQIYNVLNHMIIPVLLGCEKYENLLPPHSYVNAEDFPNIRALGIYLKGLSTNSAEYLRFFWWRDFYRLIFVRTPICDLCEKLHSSSMPAKSQTYQDIKAWWDERDCRTPADPLCCV